jgi:ATP-binding cassette subfamily B protein
MFVSAGFALLLRILLMIAGSVLMMLLIDWQLAIIMLVLLPCAGLLIWFVMHLARPIFTIVQQKLSALNTTVQENLAGVQVVKAFVQERFEINRFNTYNSDYMLESIRVGRILAVALPLLTLLTNIGLIAMIAFGGLSVINSRLTIGELVAFNSYLLISMAPLMLLGNILTMVSRAEASAERVWEVLDTQPTLKLINNPYISHSITGEISLVDVAFQYDGVNHLDEGSPAVSTRVNGRKVVDVISLEIQAGQRVAFLGATGSGKSTLISLIPRFYDPSSGSIMIDGRDVKDWDLQALRRNIGFVLQETTLFSGTIHQNIAYGRPNASLDEVIAAARIAQAHDFISALPDGYESWVEERGANLSGGQKQRIAIARALLISPKILILDDSTSSVDMGTETLIQESLDQITDELTIIIVAQRLSSVINADQICVIDSGRIEATGTHEELLQKSEIYQEIYYSQLGNGSSVQDQAAG